MQEQPLTSVQALSSTLLAGELYRGHPAAFMNLKQIVIVLSNTTTFFIQELLHVSVLKRPSSGHHHKNFKIRYNTVKSVHKLHWSWWPDNGLFRPKYVVIPELKTWLCLMES
jgi:hypothetical protein